MNFVLHAGSDLDGFVGDNSLSVVATPPVLPRLEAISSGTSRLTFQWPTNAAGYKLEESTSLAAGAWSDVTNVAAVLSTNYSIAFPMEATNRFFMLHFP